MTISGFRITLEIDRANDCGSVVENMYAQGTESLAAICAALDAVTVAYPGCRRMWTECQQGVFTVPEARPAGLASYPELYWED